MAIEARNPALAPARENVARVAREFRFPEERLRQRLAELRRGRAVASSRAAERPSAESVSAVSQLPAWDREMLELVLHEPEQLADASTAGAAAFFQSSECRAIFDTCCRLLAAGERPNFDRLLLETEDAERKALLVQLEESNHQKQPRDAAAQLAALLAHAQQQREDDFHREQIQSLEQGAFDEQGEKEVLGQLFQDLRNRQVRNDPTDG